MLRSVAVGLLLLVTWCCEVADFTFQDLQGKTHRLADYRGKWVLVNFWATWCPPCLNEMPELNSLHNAHQGKDLLVIGVAMHSGSESVVSRFVAAHHIDYPIVMGTRKSAKQIAAIDALPANYLYNPVGEQVISQVGEITRDSVERYIAAQ